jgi:Group II intron, maturase-specific domain
MVITRLNPALHGWAAYFRTVVSKHTFTAIDSYLWWLTFKWAVRTRQHGKCPPCGQLLLHADHEPHSPAEWEQWIKVVRSAIRRQAITADQRPAWPGGPAASRLLHTDCARKAARRTERKRPSPRRSARGRSSAARRRRPRRRGGRPAGANFVSSARYADVGITCITPTCGYADLAAGMAGSGLIAGWKAGIILSV